MSAGTGWQNLAAHFEREKLRGVLRFGTQGEEQKPMTRQERTLSISIVANLLLLGLKYGLAARFDSFVLRASAGETWVDTIVAALVVAGIMFSYRTDRGCQHRGQVENAMALLVSGFIFYTVYAVFRNLTTVASPLSSPLWPDVLAVLLTVIVAYVVAHYRAHVGRDSDSVSLIASSYHAWAIVYTSLLLLFDRVSPALQLTTLQPLAATIVTVVGAIIGWKAAYPALVALRQFWRSQASSGAASRLHRLTLFLVTLAAATLIIVLAYIGTYTLQPGERGVVRRFGRVVANVGPGLHYRFPIIDQLDQVALDQVRHSRTEKSLLILTGDTNLIQLNLRIHYRVIDAEAFLFNIRQLQSFIAGASEAIIRQVLAEQGVDGLLTTGRIEIEVKTRDQLQALLNQHQAGIQVTNVQLTHVTPPSAVAKAFRDVASAREDTNTSINKAQGYRNEIMPEARGQADAIVKTAEAEKQQRIDLATGEADRFLKQLHAYRKAPEITRVRLYLEALEQALPTVTKFILDPSIQTDTTDLWFTKGSSPRPQSELPEKSRQSP